DPHGHPDPVRHPDRHPRRQRGRQKRERDQVAHRYRREPHLLPEPVRGAQAHGGDELGRDRREQPDPAHAETTPSSSTGRDPVSTRTTPTMINPIPAMAAPLRNSSNRTAPSTAVSETPAAPQMPYATPMGMPVRSTTPSRRKHTRYAAGTSGNHAALSTVARRAIVPVTSAQLGPNSMSQVRGEGAGVDTARNLTGDKTARPSVLSWPSCSPRSCCSCWESSRSS